MLFMWAALTPPHKTQEMKRTPYLPPHEFWFFTEMAGFLNNLSVYLYGLFCFGGLVASLYVCFYSVDRYSTIQKFMQGLGIGFSSWMMTG
jgi:hypothetical protein